MYMFTVAVNSGWFKCDEYEKFNEAAKRGFKAMEMLIWAKLDLARVRREIDKTGVAVSAILTQTTDPEKQKAMSALRGIVNEEARDLFLEMLRETIQAAKTLGTKNIVVTTGNEMEGKPRASQHDSIVKALKAAAPLVEAAGMKIVVEPLNVLVNHKGYYLSTMAESVEIMDEVASPNVQILYDVYHQQITEGNLINNIRTHISRIGHFHVADVPGRQEPGTGEINYRNVFRAIRETGFDGFVAFECMLSMDVDTVCARMREMLEY